MEGEPRKISLGQNYLTTSTPNGPKYLVFNRHRDLNFLTSPIVYTHSCALEAHMRQFCFSGRAFYANALQEIMGLLLLLFQSIKGEEMKQMSEINKNSCNISQPFCCFFRKWHYVVQETK